MVGKPLFCLAKRCRGAFQSAIRRKLGPAALKCSNQPKLKEKLTHAHQNLQPGSNLKTAYPAVGHLFILSRFHNPLKRPASAYQNSPLQHILQPGSKTSNQPNNPQESIPSPKKLQSSCKLPSDPLLELLKYCREIMSEIDAKTPSPVTLVPQPTQTHSPLTRLTRRVTSTFPSLQHTTDVRMSKA